MVASANTNKKSSYLHLHRELILRMIQTKEMVVDLGEECHYHLKETGMERGTLSLFSWRGVSA